MSDTTRSALSLDAILTEQDVIGVVRRDLRVRLVEISGSGCLLESACQIEPGAVVMLQLGVGGREVRDAVRITRCQAVPGAGDRFRVGAEFVWLDAPGERSLRRFARMLPHAETQVRAL